MAAQLDILDQTAGVARCLGHERRPVEWICDRCGQRIPPASAEYYEANRPPFTACDDGWDRLVHLTRARDRLRRLGATDGEVVAGPRPTYRSKSRPEIETHL